MASTASPWFPPAYVPSTVQRILFLGGDSVSAFVLHRLLHSEPGRRRSPIISCRVIRPYTQFAMVGQTAKASAPTVVKEHHSRVTDCSSYVAKNIWASSALDDVCRDFSLSPHFVSDPKKFKLQDLAAALGLPPDQPATAEQCHEVFNKNYDAAVVASFKYYIPDSIVKAVTPIINVHPSLLPKYRGASPLFAPLLNGEPDHGCSIIRLWPKEGMDCGDIIKQASVPLRPSEDSRTIVPKVLDLGCDLLHDVLCDFRTHWDARTVQDRKDVKYTEDEWHAPKMDKERSRVDFSKMTGDEICNVWRAFIGSRFPLPHAVFHRMATPVASQIVSEEKKLPTRISFSEVVHSSCVPGDVLWEADAVVDQCEPGALYIPKSFGEKKRQQGVDGKPFVSEKKSKKGGGGSSSSSSSRYRDPAAIRCANRTWCWVHRATLQNCKTQDMSMLATAMNMHAGSVFPGVFS